MRACTSFPITSTTGRPSPRGRVSGVILAPSLILLGSIAAAQFGTSTAIAAPPMIVWGTACPPTPGLPDLNMECGTVSVPLDYRNPNGRTIDIAVSRIQSSRPDLRRGVLLLNPGGPGGAGLDLPRLFSILLPTSVSNRYDLIGFDPRGIARSSPVSCGLPPLVAQETFPPLEQQGGFEATVDFVRNVANSCAAISGDLLPFITTLNTARDMERMREALGEQKISYLGYSYGTYLGAVYSQLFPARTDRIVLDSAVNPNHVWRTQFRKFGLGSEIRFPDFARFAAANDATYHFGSTPEQVRETYFELYDKVQRTPIQIPGGPLITGPVFRGGTFNGLYFDAIFPNLAAFWELVRAAPGATATQSTAVLAFPEVPADNDKASAVAIICGDAPWSRSIGQYRIELAIDSAAFPMFGPMGSHVYPCAFWPNDPIEPPLKITTQGPANILVAQNLRDPATPYESGVGMRLALGARARLITIDQGGHTAYVLPNVNTCVNNAISAYLAEGTYPPTDRFCPADAAVGNSQPAASPHRQGQDPNGAIKEQAVQEIIRRMAPPIPH